MVFILGKPLYIYKGNYICNTSLYQEYFGFKEEFPAYRLPDGSQGRQAR